MFLFVRKAHQRDIKPSDGMCEAWQACWGNGGREMCTRTTQKENWRDTDAFSTYLLNLE